MPTVRDPRIGAGLDLIAALQQAEKKKREQQLLSIPGQPVPVAANGRAPSVGLHSTPQGAAQGTVQGAVQGIPQGAQQGSLLDLGLQAALGQGLRSGLLNLSGLGDALAPSGSLFGPGGLFASSSGLGSLGAAGAGSSAIGGPISAIPVAGGPGAAAAAGPIVAGLPLGPAAFISAPLLLPFLNAATGGLKDKPSFTSVIGFKPNSDELQITASRGKDGFPEAGASAVGNQLVSSLNRLRRELGGSFDRNKAEKADFLFDVSGNGSVVAIPQAFGAGKAANIPFLHFNAKDAEKAFLASALKLGLLKGVDQATIDAKIADLTEGGRLFDRELSVVRRTQDKFSGAIQEIGLKTEPRLALFRGEPNEPLSELFEQRELLDRQITASPEQLDRAGLDATVRNPLRKAGVLEPASVAEIKARRAKLPLLAR